MTEVKTNRSSKLLCVLLAAVLLFSAVIPPKASATSTVEYYRNAVLFWTNVERSRQGLTKLKAAPALITAANVRVKELPKLYSHTRPNGKAWNTAMDANKAKYGSAAENIARGYKDPCAAVVGWMESEGHRKNMLSSKYKYLGAGYCKAADGDTYWEQLFTGKVTYSDAKSAFKVTAKSISTTKTSIKLAKGKTTTFLVNPSPVYATQEITCKSSNTKVAKVSGITVNKIKIKAVAKGTAKLTVKCGNCSKTVTVTVS